MTFRHAILAAGLIGLVGCTNASQTGTQIASGLTSFIVSAQPIASALACDAQAIANLVTASLSGGAAKTSGKVSAIAGTWCNGLAQGAPLPTPVVASGTATVMGTGGLVTVPVPATVNAASP